MRKLVLLMHTSLDGYAAGPAGEMDWIKADEAMFDFVGEHTRKADTALYGRVTYDLMQSYWPTAGNKPNASKHDKEHAAWYNNVEKYVVSKTLSSNPAEKLSVISKNIADEIKALKSRPGKDILLIGSPSLTRELIAHNLIDDYWLHVNPVILGKGLPVYPGGISTLSLKAGTVKYFNCGVTALNFQSEL